MVESLWVRIKGQTSNVDVIVVVHYRPSGQDNDTDELFFEELRDAPKSTALVLMGDFNFPEISWKNHTLGIPWARRFLKKLDDDFMEQVLRESTQKDALLDLLLVNRVDLEKYQQNLNSGHEESRLRDAQELNDRPRGSQRPELEDHECENDQLLVDPEIVWDLLLQLDPYKSDGIHPRILRGG
ncbi:hypothetical protein BTVI_60226 [Pitangus sulphuratus]|nr:hypothetical protein BTVI_60226 [Pitangus sulphuratus]